jgi:hypothetical protein
MRESQEVYCLSVLTVQESEGACGWDRTIRLSSKLSGKVARHGTRLPLSAPPSTIYLAFLYDYISSVLILPHI